MNTNVTSLSFSSLIPETKKAATAKRKRTRANPSLTYAEYMFLKDLANNKVVMINTLITTRRS